MWNEIKHMAYDRKNGKVLLVIADCPKGQKYFLSYMKSWNQVNRHLENNPQALHDLMCVSENGLKKKDLVNVGT